MGGISYIVKTKIKSQKKTYDVMNHICIMIKIPIIKI